MTTFDHLVLDASPAETDQLQPAHLQPGGAVARLVSCVGRIITLT